MLGHGLGGCGDVWVAPRHDLSHELWLRDPTGGLLRRDRRRRAASDREVVDAHAPALAATHDVEPPGVMTARTSPAGLWPADPRCLARVTLDRFASR